MGDYPPPPHKNSTKHYFVVKVLKVVLRFMTMILKRIKEQVQEHIPMVIKRFEEESNKPPIKLLVLFRFFHENRRFFQGYKELVKSPRTVGHLKGQKPAGHKVRNVQTQQTFLHRQITGSVTKLFRSLRCWSDWNRDSSLILKRLKNEAEVISKVKTPPNEGTKIEKKFDISCQTSYVAIEKNSTFLATQVM